MVNYKLCFFIVAMKNKILFSNPGLKLPLSP